MAFEFPSPYKNTSVGGDIFSYRGGYAVGWPSKEAAMAGIAEDQRHGTTIAVNEGGVAVEYWWKSGTTLEHLILKDDATVKFDAYQPSKVYETGHVFKFGTTLFRVIDTIPSIPVDSTQYAHEYAIIPYMHTWVLENKIEVVAVVETAAFTSSMSNTLLVWGPTFYIMSAVLDFTNPDATGNIELQASDTAPFVLGLKGTMLYKGNIKNIGVTFNSTQNNIFEGDLSALPTENGDVAIYRFECFKTGVLTLVEKRILNRNVGAGGSIGGGSSLEVFTQKAWPAGTQVTTQTGIWEAKQNVPNSEPEPTDENVYWLPIARWNAQDKGAFMLVQPDGTHIYSNNMQNLMDIASPYAVITMNSDYGQNIIHRNAVTINTNGFVLSGLYDSATSGTFAITGGGRVGMVRLGAYTLDANGNPTGDPIGNYGTECYIDCELNVFAKSNDALDGTLDSQFFCHKVTFAKPVVVNVAGWIQFFGGTTAIYQQGAIQYELGKDNFTDTGADGGNAGGVGAYLQSNFTGTIFMFGMFYFSSWWSILWCSGTSAGKVFLEDTTFVNKHAGAGNKRGIVIASSSTTQITTRGVCTISTIGNAIRREGLTPITINVEGELLYTADISGPVTLNRVTKGTIGNSSRVTFAATNTFSSNKVMALGGTGDVFNANHTLANAASGNMADTFLTVVVVGNGTNTITFGSGWQNENAGTFDPANGKKNIIRMHYLDDSNKFYTITQPA